MQGNNDVHEAAEQLLMTKEVLEKIVLDVYKQSADANVFCDNLNKALPEIANRRDKAFDDFAEKIKKIPGTSLFTDIDHMKGKSSNEHKLNSTIKNMYVHLNRVYGENKSTITDLKEMYKITYKDTASSLGTKFVNNFRVKKYTVKVSKNAFQECFNDLSKAVGIPVKKQAAVEI